jgi:hypothetical protein
VSSGSGAKSRRGSICSDETNSTVHCNRRELIKYPSTVFIESPDVKINMMQIKRESL